MEVMVNGVGVARVLFRPTETKEVPVRLMNVTATELRVPARTVVGKIYRVEETPRTGGLERSLQKPHQVRGLGRRSRDSLVDSLDLSHIDMPDREQLIRVLKEYRDVFLEKGSPLGCTEQVRHKINCGESPLIAKAPYRVPYHQKGILKDQIEGMLPEGIITPSCSAWSAPVDMVSKKSLEGESKVRLCIDYRGLNAVTKRDFFPLPNLQETLDQLGQATLFTTLDLASGYWQVEGEPKDREKTAFSTPDGHYECTRMPFGLANSPSTWQRLMFSVLSGLTGDKCLVYLDDIIIFSSQGVEEHLKRLSSVLDRMRKAQLVLKPSKCQFLRKETTYLRHVISEEGVKPDPEKIEVIRNYPTPRTVKDIRAFLGLVGFYRRFIPEFSHLSTPMTALTKKDARFHWTEEAQEAFHKLHTALTTKPVLRYPDFALPFVLTTNASGYALEAILSQKFGDHDHPISYASRQMNQAERNLSTTERECLAVIWAVKHFRCYLLGRRFTLITDHRPLKWLLTVKDPSSKLTRWALTLSEYDFEIVHRLGRLHGNADALSRLMVGTITDHYEPAWDQQRVREEQRRDPQAPKYN